MLGLRSVAMNKSANLKGWRIVQGAQWSLNYLVPLYPIRVLKMELFYFLLLISCLSK